MGLIFKPDPPRPRPARDNRFPGAAINPDHLTYQPELRRPKFHRRHQQQGGTIVDSALRNDHLHRRYRIDFAIDITDAGRTAGNWSGSARFTHLAHRAVTPAPLKFRANRRRANERSLAVLKDADARRAVHKLNIVLCTGPKDHGPRMTIALASPLGEAI